MASVNDAFAPSCETACASITLLTASSGCFSTNFIELSEIVRIYIDEPATSGVVPKNPITGWVNTGLAASDIVNAAAITTWKGLHSQTVASKIRTFTVIGDKPAGSGTEITGPEGKVIKIGNKETVPFSVQVRDNLQYAFFQKLKGCGGNIFFWYETTGGFLYGGINGIQASIKSVDDVLARGVGSVATIEVAFEYIAKTFVPRDKMPV